jgi:hypothetical protein
MTKSLTLATALLCCASHAAYAQSDRWLRVGKDDGYALDMDRRTVTSNGSAYDVWFRVTYPRAKTEGDTRNVKSFKAHERIDCGSRELDEIALYKYDTSGMVLDSFEKPFADVQIKSPIPESLGDEMVEYLCDNYLPSVTTRSVVPP